MAGEQGTWPRLLGWMRQNWLQVPTLAVGLLTLLGVSTLNSRMSTSEMLVQQIENLKKSDDIHRNVSILAIEHTLSSRSPVEGVHHDLLLIRVLNEILRYDKAAGLLVGEKSEASRQRVAHIHRILREKLVELNPACARRFDALADAGSRLEFESSDAVVSPEAGLQGLIASGECRSAAALGVLPVWWPGKATHDTVLRTSVLSLAEIQGTTAAEEQKPLSSQITRLEDDAAAGEPGSLDVTQLSGDALATATQIVTAAVVSDERKKVVAQKWGKAPEAQHVFLHYDNRSDFAAVKKLAQELSQQGYFVEKTIRLVPPEDRACAARSQVKYFHEEDRDEARKLLQKTNELVPKPKRIRLDGERGLTDLSNWTLSAKVPRGQLELWWIASGDRCEAARADRAGRESAEG